MNSCNWGSICMKFSRKEKGRTRAWEGRTWLARFSVVSLHLIKLNYNCGIIVGRQLGKVSRAHAIMRFLIKKPPQSEVLRMHLVCFPSSFCGLGQSTSRALCGFFKGSHPVTNRWYSPDCHVDLHAEFNQFDKGFHWLHSCVCN